MNENATSRRQALKTILAAGGGLGAAAFLPGKWLKPVVKAGVLPAHAQASLTLYVKGFYASDPTGHQYPACCAAVSSTPFTNQPTSRADLCEYDESAGGPPVSPSPVAGVSVTVWKTSPTLVQHGEAKLTDSNGITGVWYFEDRYQGADVIFKLSNGTFCTLCIPS